MQRRKFSREFKLEAVRMVRERWVTIAQASRDLDVHANVLRKWVRELAADPGHAFPGHGQIAGADADRSPAARAGQVEGGARHPKKAAAYFARDSI